MNARLALSERDLAAALDVRNRTCELQETAQAQLLQVESMCVCVCVCVHETHAVK